MKTESLSYGELLDLEEKLRDSTDQISQLAYEATLSAINRRELASGKRLAHPHCRRVSLTGGTTATV